MELGDHPAGKPRVQQGGVQVVVPAMRGPGGRRLVRIAPGAAEDLYLEGAVHKPPTPRDPQGDGGICCPVDGGGMWTA